MGVSPQRQGKYGKAWTINLNTDSGADNITGVSTGNISVIVRSANGSFSDISSTGTITIVTNNPAQITWQPTVQDYANVGDCQSIVNVIFGTGPVEYDPIPFTIKP